MPFYFTETTSGHNHTSSWIYFLSINLTQGKQIRTPSTYIILITPDAPPILSHFSHRFIFFLSLSKSFLNLEGCNKYNFSYTPNKSQHYHDTNSAQSSFALHKSSKTSDRVAHHAQRGTKAYMAVINNMMYTAPFISLPPPLATSREQVSPSPTWRTAWNGSRLGML